MEAAALCLIGAGPSCSESDRIACKSRDVSRVNGTSVGAYAIDRTIYYTKHVVSYTATTALLQNAAASTNLATEYSMLFAS